MRGINDEAKKYDVRRTSLLRGLEQGIYQADEALLGSIHQINHKDSSIYNLFNLMTDHPEYVVKEVPTRRAINTRQSTRIHLRR